MPEIALVVLGLFVLVWIISAVVKASQNGGSKQPGPSPRQRPASSDSPRVERTSNSDIDRFMAEIDRLRRRGEGAPAGRAPEPPRPAPRTIEPSPRPSQRVEQRPRPAEREREKERDRDRDRERRDRERERRQRPSARPAPAPPPRVDPVPVLRPVAPEAPAPPPATPPKPARPPRAALPAGVTAPPPSAVLLTLQSVLKSKQGPAAALILAEILGEPPGRRGTVRPPHRPKHG